MFVYQIIVYADVGIVALKAISTTFLLRVFESRDDHLEAVEVGAPRIRDVPQRQEVGLRVHSPAVANVGYGFVTRYFYL